MGISLSYHASSIFQAHLLLTIPHVSFTTHPHSFTFHCKVEALLKSFNRRFNPSVSALHQGTAHKIHKFSLDDWILRQCAIHKDCKNCQAFVVKVPPLSRDRRMWLRRDSAEDTVT